MRLRPVIFHRVAFLFIQNFKEEEMALKYKLVQRGNPSKPEDPKKFYASAVNAGEMSLRALPC